jgi:hypothetical protein
MPRLALVITMAWPFGLKLTVNSYPLSEHKSISLTIILLYEQWIVLLGSI